MQHTSGKSRRCATQCTSCEEQGKREQYLPASVRRWKCLQTKKQAEEGSQARMHQMPMSVSQLVDR